MRLAKYPKIITLNLAVVIILVSCQSVAPVTGIDIHDIQGCSHDSPMVDRQVTNVQGVVTQKMDNGFVMQSTAPDDKTCSSEAIFVHTGSYPRALTRDLVAVDGKVAEFNAGDNDQKNLSQTEITEAAVRIIRSGVPFPEATALGENGYPFPRSVIKDDAMSSFNPQNDGLDYYESLEWMRVELPSMIVVGPRNSYNEIVVAELQGGTTESRAQNALVETASDLHPERLMIQLPGDWTRKVNMGDEIGAGLIGILTYSYGNFKLDPATDVELIKYSGNSSETTTINYNELRIATYNINNFSKYNKTSKIKAIASQIADDLKSPDLLVLQEVMDDSGNSDDGTVSAGENLALLVDQIKQAGGEEYRYFDFVPEDNTTGGIQGGNIRTVFLLRSNSPLKLNVSMEGLGQNVKIQSGNGGNLEIYPNPGQFGFDTQAFSNIRKPIVGLFTYGERQVIVVGLHLVSKGLNTPLYGSVQPIDQPELDKRAAEAQVVNDWIESIFKRASQTIIIVAGDMNDGFGSQVLQTLQGTTLQDSAGEVDEVIRFSLLNDGLAMLFDHILVSKNTVIKNVEIPHLNSIFDSSSQVSDHDPVMITLESK